MPQHKILWNEAVQTHILTTDSITGWFETHRPKLADFLNYHISPHDTHIIGELGIQLTFSFNS
jgi:hypothetical protein